jgi:hypothetical protein
MAFSFLHVLEQRIGMSYGKYSFRPRFPETERIDSVRRVGTSPVAKAAIQWLSCRHAAPPAERQAPAAPARRSERSIAGAIPS